MVGQSCCHGRGARPPHLRCTLAMGDFGSRQRLAQTGVRQNKVVIHLEQGQLIPQARCALTESIDPASDRCDPLADVEVQPFDKRGIDRPAPSRQHLLNGQPGAEHHAVCDAHEASAPLRLDNLGVE